MPPHPHSAHTKALRRNRNLRAYLRLCLIHPICWAWVALQSQHRVLGAGPAGRGAAVGPGGGGDPARIANGNFAWLLARPAVSGTGDLSWIVAPAESRPAGQACSHLPCGTDGQDPLPGVPTPAMDADGAATSEPQPADLGPPAMTVTVESMLISAYSPSFVSRVRPSTLAKIASCATRGIPSQIAEAATHRSAS
jgi:hypothetical protein